MTDDQHRSIVGAATSLGEKLIGSMPATFLMMCVLNAVFLAAFGYFLVHVMDQRDDRDEQRTALVAKLLDSCVAHATKDRT